MESSYRVLITVNMLARFRGFVKCVDVVEYTLFGQRTKRRVANMSYPGMLKTERTTDHILGRSEFGSHEDGFMLHEAAIAQILGSDPLHKTKDLTQPFMIFGFLL